LSKQTPLIVVWPAANDLLLSSFHLPMRSATSCFCLFFLRRGSLIRVRTIANFCLLFQRTLPLTTMRLVNSCGIPHSSRRVLGANGLFLSHSYTPFPLSSLRALPDALLSLKEASRPFFLHVSSQVFPEFHFTREAPPPMSVVPRAVPVFFLHKPFFFCLVKTFLPASALDPFFSFLSSSSEKGYVDERLYGHYLKVYFVHYPKSVSSFGLSSNTRYLFFFSRGWQLRMRRSSRKNLTNFFCLFFSSLYIYIPHLVVLVLIVFS